ncbi:MAG TPA: cytochrome C oxidase subunit IV family protein [Candidatus Acidoferrum sp.]|nr:cytochrome C oxidase subunit IV family protein [Candidatus Acidoferrum sp.]
MSNNAEHSEHIVSPGLYIAIFAALMILTGTTVWAATVDLNEYFASLNVIVALVIATCKAILVILFFMHAYYSSKRTKLIIICGFFWLAIMLSLTLSDYSSRYLDVH